MTPFAWLMALTFPACRTAGADGVPSPALTDMTHIARPATPNTALAAPAGFAIAPDLVTPVYPISAGHLYSAIKAVAATQPRTFVAAEFAQDLQIHWVVRSALFNFPDLVTAQVNAAGPQASTVILYSRSVYGHSDLGVNRKRLLAWLAALNQQQITAAEPPSA